MRDRHNLYSIKETSELADVPVHTLRFWQRKLPDYLSPERTAGRQRRYSEGDLEKIRRLDYFVNQKGMTLLGARRMIEEGKGPEDLDPGLTERVPRDKRVSQAIDELARLIRRRVLEAMGEEER